MKKTLLKSLLAVFALLLVCGNVRGESVTATLIWSEQGLANATKVNDTPFSIDSNFSVTCARNEASTNPTYYDIGTAVRCYVTKNTSNGNTITVATATDGVYITKVTFNGSHNKKGTTEFTYSPAGSSSDATSVSYAEASKVQSATATLCETGGNSNGQFYFTDITVEYVTGGVVTPTVATPVIAPASCTFEDEICVQSITCETADATILYNTDNWTTTHTYNGVEGLCFQATTTLQAKATKAGYNDSGVASATYTLVTTMTTMDEIFAAATAAGSTATPARITFGNWVVSGVNANTTNVYVTDGTKGFIIYDKTGLGFEVGDVLSGTVSTKVQLYRGSAELTELTTTTPGLTVTKGGSVTFANIDLFSLSGINTGALINVPKAIVYNDNMLSIGGTSEADDIKVYNALYSGYTLVNGLSYNVTGIYLQYNSVKEILPRNEADIVLINTTVTSIAINGYKTTFEKGDTFEFGGTVTATFNDGSTTDVTSAASFSDYDMETTGVQTVTVSYGGQTTTYTITVVAGALSMAWDLTTNNITNISEEYLYWVAPQALMIVNKAAASTNANNYYGGNADNRTSTRFYKGSEFCIAPAEGINIKKVVFEATTSSYASTLSTSTWSNAGCAVNDKTVTVTPVDGTQDMTATIGGTCGFTSVTVFYEEFTSATTVSNLSVTAQKTDFNVGDAFDFVGYVYAIYSDGTSHNVTPLASFSGYDMNNAGTQTVTVSYKGETATYEITCTAPVTLTVTLNSNGFATFANANATNVVSGGKAYYATDCTEGIVSFTEVSGAIYGSRGVLLQGEPGATVTLEYATGTATAPAIDLLWGFTADKAVDELDTAYDWYGLKGDQFLRLEGGTISAGKAALRIPKGTQGSGALTIRTGGATLVEKMLQENGSTEIYDMLGRRVENVTKGIYIINGKKVMVR
jgi:hypothetical protein